MTIGYLVFAGMNYYPSGGSKDLLAVESDPNKSTAEELAVRALRERAYGYGNGNDWSEVVQINLKEYTFKTVVRFWKDGSTIHEKR